MSADQPAPQEADFALNVVIRSMETGLYVQRVDQHPAYTASFEQALVLDYVSDQVPHLIQDVRKHLGHFWQAVPLRISDALETCDSCQGLFGVPEIAFDGTRFLCVRCRDARRP